VNIEPFLTPIDDPAPSGVELRNDARFHALERALEPASRAARTDKDGTVNVNPQVDWQDILASAADLAGSGRDLRLLVIVARAMANTDGYRGLAQGLDLIAQSIDAFWDSIHPELRDRPDAAEAALRRSNALKQLENDENGLLGDLAMGALLMPRGLGPVRGEDVAKAGLSDFEVMNEAPSGLGEVEKAAIRERHAARVNRVTAACRALAAEEPERAAEMISAISAADAARLALEAKYSEKAGLSNGMGLQFGALGTFLSRLRATLDRLARPDDAATEPAAEAPASAPAAQPSASAVPAPASAPGGGIAGGVNSRRDVEKALDMIIAFYERTEPSSPIPHIARRLRKMVPMNFVQLMEEIAPSGMKEFRNIAGTDEKSK
jgi:type VI secretion system protein ImpA